MVVLDRPNPIGGLAVAGPVRDDEFASFIAYHALPVRHGMTVGELARLFNAERKIGADLTVIPCAGWPRADFYDRTGLVWVNPSPNMRSLTEALLYPGRRPAGGDQPGDRPRDGHARSSGSGRPGSTRGRSPRRSNAAGVPGVRFVPIRFTPRERQYAGGACGGVQIIVDDWSRFDPLRLGIRLAVQLRALYPREWEPEGLAPPARRPGRPTTTSSPGSRWTRSWRAGSRS